MSASGVDVSRRKVFQALMIALMVVVADKRIDLRFKIAGQEVVLQQDAILERLMLTLYLTLGLRMVRRTACVRHAFVRQLFGKVARDVTRPIVRQEAWTMHNIGLIKATGFKRKVERVLDIGCAHSRA